MTSVGITGACLSTGTGLVGAAGLAGALGWPGGPEPGGDAAAATQAMQAFRRRSGLRYLDPGVERDVRAIRGGRSAAAGGAA